MAFSISGNCGLAGATVFWCDSTTAAGDLVTSDGSGNYNTGVVLTNGSTYQIYPTKPGYQFSPQFAERTISGANITGINFTVAALNASLAFTQLTQDTFHRADEEPLNNGVWVQSPFFEAHGAHTLIHNNICTIDLPPTTTQSDSDTWNTAIDWSSIPDHWIEFQLQDLNNGALFMYIRAGITGNISRPCYRFCLFSTYGGKTPDGTLNGWFVDQFGTNNTIDYSWQQGGFNFQPQAWQQGDVIRFGVIGGATGHLYVLLNGVLLFIGSIAAAVTAGASLLSNGVTVAMQLTSGAVTPAYTDIGVVNFKGGSLSINTGPVVTLTSSQLNNLQSLVAVRVQQIQTTNPFEKDEIVLAKAVLTALQGAS